MAEGLIGKKLGMTQLFGEDGTVYPVTVIEAGPCTVVQIKTREKDGYEALQLGFGEAREKNLDKAKLGHLKKNSLPPIKILREFKGFTNSFNIGDKLTVDIFNGTKTVKVTGKSKGKGFQGVIKRHGFHGGPASHGSRFHRAPGSMSANSDPARIFKGKKLPGHKGDDFVTIKNIRIHSLDAEKNLICVVGSIPGKTNSMVVIEKLS